MKLTKGEIAAFKWLEKIKVLWLPNTIYPTGWEQWNKHKPASVQSFYSLERKGLAKMDRTNSFKFGRWELTEKGKEKNR